MSLLRSGSDLNRETHVFSIEDQSQTGEVRRFSAALCRELNFTEIQQARASLVINELCTNLLKYSIDGRILVRAVDQASGLALELLAIDKGPGIQNIEIALSDGFTTGTSPGTGLGAVRRQSNEFDIYSQPEKGTIVLSIIYAAEDQKKPAIEIGAINVPIKGESVCGDAWFVSENGSDISLIMADGLGHGPLAKHAALEAIDEFSKTIGLGIEPLLVKIHGRLHATRGAAVSMAHWSDFKEISYVAVGNIRALSQPSQGPARTFLNQNGTAGLRIPRLKTYEHSWLGDGFLIMHSDGLKTQWDLNVYPHLFNHHASIVAATIFRDFNRNSDDATVVVIRGQP